MISVNQNLNKKQVFIYEYQKWRNFNPLPRDRFIVGKIKSWTYKKKMALNAIVTLCNRYQNVYATEETIAKMAHCSVSALKIYFDEFIEEGLMSKFNRGVKITNFYKISPWFSYQNIQELLAQFLPYFYYLQKKIQSLFPRNWLQCTNVLRTYIYNELILSNFDNKIKESEEKEKNQRKILQGKVDLLTKGNDSDMKKVVNVIPKYQTKLPLQKEPQTLEEMLRAKFKDAGIEWED